MSSDPEGLVLFEAAGKKFTAVFGHKAMKTIESQYDMPFFKVVMSALPQLKPEDLSDPSKVAEASANVRLTDVSNLFTAALLKHHRDLSEDEIDDMIDDIGIQEVARIVGSALSASLSTEGDNSSKENPPRSNQKRRTG